MTWAEAIDQVVYELAENTGDTDYDDTTIRQFIDGEYTALCHETWGAFDEITYTEDRTSADLETVLMTAVDGGPAAPPSDPFAAVSVSGTSVPIALIAAPEAATSTTAEFKTVQAARDQSQLRALGSRNKTGAYLAKSQKIYMPALSSGDDTRLRLVVAFHGPERFTAQEASDSPAFNAAVERLGQETLVYRTAAALARAHELSTAGALSDKAIDYTGRLKDAVAKVFVSNPGMRTYA